MLSVVENLVIVHVYAWGLTAIVGILVGTYLARRGISFGTSVLVLLVLMWSMFVGMLPLLNHAVSPDGIAGAFAGQGIGRFFESASPQAILEESAAHRNEVLLSAGIGAVVFASLGFLRNVFLGNRDD